MDEFGLPNDYFRYVRAYKKILRFILDETNGRKMYKFIGLQVKSYTYDIKDVVTIKSKGIKNHVIKNHMTFNGPVFGLLIRTATTTMIVDGGGR